MNLPAKIKVKPQTLKTLIFALFLFVHLALFGINAVEWGDSYRILRGAEYIRRGTYPADEKRPPLYSAVLSLRPFSSLDPVFWGRIVMLGVSVASFWVFYRLALLVFAGDRVKTNVALLLFALNPVYLYWSLRIYADVLFSLWVLLAGYVYVKHKENLQMKHVFLLAFVSALSIFTRFEGYLLAFSLGVALLLKDFKKALTFSAMVLGMLLPYWLWRNPLGSSYFEEPSGRAYDFKMLLNYAVSLFFLFGFTSAPAFFVAFPKKVFKFFKNHLFFAAFTVLELLLILAWPAAIPRLFVPIIPLLILPLASSIEECFRKNSSFLLLGLAGILPLFYVVAQRFLVLQFLVPSFKLVLILAFLNMIAVFFLWRKQPANFLVLASLSMMLWSLGVIWAHKDIYATIQEAAEFAGGRLAGTIAYNDTSSVTPWYLDENPHANPAVTGKFFPYGESEDLSQANLTQKGYNYILFTNEHNSSLEVDFEKRPYLKVLNTFEKRINGSKFFTKLVEVKN